ncbi:hypothetical protein [Flaviaesturariibacter aridisoli]|uniref:Uncharacterized protein n=1 Tax=Flaviaesturariibacter aridisoli TaxID=2545761 RepID=A0A4R4DZX7_9BACT|nr:hypothetical protein [Flaviaesturariibacter aridisoli]TCZ70519.1 hypothetical protein E0486_11220 [Flaviaesturariibacter aridisoli]
MRKKIFQTMLVSAGALLAFTTHDVVSEMGTTVAEVKELTVKQVYAQQWSMPWVNAKVRSACKSLPAGAREAALLALGKVVRDYVGSPEFEKDYFAYVESNRRYSAPAADDDKTAAERKRREDYEMGHLKDPLSFGGAVMYCTAIATSARTMLDLIKDNPDLPLPMGKDEYERMEREGKRLRSLFDTDKESFKKQYVAFKVDNELRSERASKQHDAQQEATQVADRKDYKKYIRAQIEQFLQATAHINFKAATKQQGGKIVFVDAPYEAMPNDWKFYYRCGPEAVGGARKAAQEWLKELN